MDISGNDNNVEASKGIEESYNVPNMITMGNSISMVESSSCSASMVDPIWNQSINGQSLGYCEMNVQTNASPSSSLGPVRIGSDWTTNGMFLPNGPRMLPHNLPHFPADSAFIQRAAKFSFFNGGNFGEMVDSFSIPLNPLSQGFGPIQEPGEVFVGKDEKSESVVRSHEDAKNGADVSGTRPDKAEFSGRGAREESSGKGKKRKKTDQKIENNEAPQPSFEAARETAEQEDDQNPLSTHRSDPPKEDYIHVRARRGQATNSHSLAERVRREKISERMKFLQDLVPGCSKVTGKAVMLDEIINYVQSLQRQVEFLSMKLATVNPRLNFNTERFVAKDIPQPRTGPSSSLAFPPDITMPVSPLHQPHPSLIPASLPIIANSSETLQRPTGSVVCGGFNEPASQVPRIWDNELHNVVHNSFNSTASLNSQDLSASLPPGHTKTEI